MGLFDNYNEIEKGLLEMYSQIFTAIGLPDAKKVAKTLLNQAIEKSKKEGTYNLPSNFGDIILKKQTTGEPVVEKAAEIIRRTLPRKRSERVRDADIRWWWNLNDVERNIMLAVDEMNRLSTFTDEYLKYENGEESAKKVWKFHPTYGDPTDKTSFPSWVKEEDLPLPFELKDRINIYIEKRAKSDPERYKREVETSSTFNSLVRKEIKAGNI